MILEIKFLNQWNKASNWSHFTERQMVIMIAVSKKEWLKQNFCIKVDEGLKKTLNQQEPVILNIIYNWVNLSCVFS